MEVPHRLLMSPFERILEASERVFGLLIVLSHPFFHFLRKNIVFSAAAAEVIIPDEVIEVADKDEVKTEALEADLTFVTPAAPAADEEEIIAVAASAVAVEEKDGVTVIEEKTAAVAAGEDNDVVVVEENVVTVKEEEEEVAQLAEEKVYKVEEAEEPVIEKVYGGKPEETPYVPFSYTSSRPEKVYGQPSTATSDSDDELDKMRTLARFG